MQQPFTDQALHAPRRGFASALAPYRLHLPDVYTAQFAHQTLQPAELWLPDTTDHDSKLLTVLNRFDDRSWTALLAVLNAAHSGTDAHPIRVQLLETALRLYRYSPTYLQYFHSFTVNLLRHLAGQNPYFNLPSISVFMLEVHASDVEYLIQHAAFHTVLPEVMGFNLVHFQLLQLAARLAAPMRLLKAHPAVPFQLGPGFAQLLNPEPTFATDVNCPLVVLLTPQWLLEIGPALAQHPTTVVVELNQPDTTDWNTRLSTPPRMLCFPA